ncbi:MAG TPA: hypothetical protein VHB50_05110 [Bryobacteraceae bacterium]|nr:hypothetical protein [Bryobacteraceae bacterium]
MALFPGAWNPPTVAHLAIARAALIWAGEVVWTLPRAFPHKEFDRARLEDRVEMLGRIAEAEPQFSVALTDGGLYLEMAQEAREFYGPDAEIRLVCGRDAAERIARWDYGRPGVFEDMIGRFPMLVAGRAGEYAPDPEHAERITVLDAGPGFDEVSSSEVRRRMEGGEDWEGLVPGSIRSLVRAIYG